MRVVCADHHSHDGQQGPYRKSDSHCILDLQWTHTAWSREPDQCNVTVEGHTVVEIRVDVDIFCKVFKETIDAHIVYCKPDYRNV